MTVSKETPWFIRRQDESAIRQLADRTQKSLGKQPNCSRYGHFNYSPADEIALSARSAGSSSAFFQYLRLYTGNSSRHCPVNRGRSSVFRFQVRHSVEEIAVDLDAQTTATLIGKGLAEDLIDDSDREVELAVEPPASSSAYGIVALEEVRRRLLGQSPKQFETTISELLMHTGFREVEVTRYSQDGGIDVNARPGDASWPLRHLLVQVQAKRHRLRTRSVGARLLSYAAVFCRIQSDVS